MTDKKAEILRCGKELFSVRGFKDTNVADITKMAGIAAGTFYIYYPSKDKLFMEIYLEENARLKKSILDSLDMDSDPMKVIQEMMFLNLQGMISNPILKEWYNRDVFNKIERNFREENGIGQIVSMYESFTEVVKKWQTDGKMRDDIDAEMIMVIFSALINVETHKEEIGLQYFPKVIEYLAEFVMKGLIKSSIKNE